MIIYTSRVSASVIRLGCKNQLTSLATIYELPTILMEYHIRRYAPNVGVSLARQQSYA